MANLMMTIFAVVGVGGGIAIVRFPDRVARFFKSGADTMYPERWTKKVYTARNARQGGVGSIVFGLVALTILIWRLFNGFGFA